MTSIETKDPVRKQHIYIEDELEGFSKYLKEKGHSLTYKTWYNTQGKKVIAVGIKGNDKKVELLYLHGRIHSMSTAPSIWQVFMPRNVTEGNTELLDEVLQMYREYKGVSNSHK